MRHTYDPVPLYLLRKARRGIILKGRGLIKDLATEVFALRRKVKAQFRDGFDQGLEKAATIVCPSTHVEEERSCEEVAALIRMQKREEL